MLTKALVCGGYYLFSSWGRKVGSRWLLVKSICSLLGWALFFSSSYSSFVLRWAFSSFLSSHSPFVGWAIYILGYHMNWWQYVCQFAWESPRLSLALIWTCMWMKDIGGLFGCGEGGAMVKERGIVILYHQCHGRNF